jgi:ribosomal protein L7/L12
MFFGKKDEISGEKETFSLNKFRQFVEEDRKIEAIKMVRQFSDTGLKESKDFVEHYQAAGCSWEAVREAYRDMAYRLTGEGREEDRKEEPQIGKNEIKEIENLLRSGNKIMSIKKVRELTNVGLKEAKDFVDYLGEVNFSWELVSEKFPSMAENLNITTSESSGNVNLVWLNLPSGDQEAFSYEDRIKIEDLIKQGQKIMAVKIIRDITDMRLGLKEAKDLADDLERAFS